MPIKGGKRKRRVYDTAISLVHLLRDLKISRACKQYVLVFDEVEKLARFGGASIEQILMLPRFVHPNIGRTGHLNLAIIMVAEDPSIVRHYADGVCPEYLHFPNYNREELGAILKDAVVSASSNFLGRRVGMGKVVANFVHIVLTTLYPVTRDLRRLKRIILRLFPMYIKPLKNGQGTYVPVPHTIV